MWFIGIPQLGHARTEGALEPWLTFTNLAAQVTDGEPVTSSPLADCQTCCILNSQRNCLPDIPEDVVPNIHSLPAGQSTSLHGLLLWSNPLEWRNAAGLRPRDSAGLQTGLTEQCL